MCCHHTTSKYSQRGNFKFAEKLVSGKPLKANQKFVGAPNFFREAPKTNMFFLFSQKKKTLEKKYDGLLRRTPNFTYHE